MERFIRMNNVQPASSGFGANLYGGGMSRGMMILCGLLVLIVIGIIIYLFYSLSAPSSKSGFQPNNSNNNSNASSSAELLFFYTDWCPHCKTAKPVWNEIKSEYENKTINGHTLVFTEVNCTDENAEVEKMMNQYNIEGYPTIKLLKDGQVIEYDAKPSKETLEQFLNTVL
jgi:thiol-disulfide isomerase/thioredoxin